MGFIWVIMLSTRPEKLGAAWYMLGNRTGYAKSCTYHSCDGLGTEEHSSAKDSPPESTLSLINFSGITLGRHKEETGVYDEEYQDRYANFDNRIENLDYQTGKIRSALQGIDEDTAAISGLCRGNIIYQMIHIIFI